MKKICTKCNSVNTMEAVKCHNCYERFTANYRVEETPLRIKTSNTIYIPSSYPDRTHSTSEVWSNG